MGAEHMQPIAALYVQTDGSYFNIEGVVPWDEESDARMYEGPHPVIAHPPCRRWGKLWAGQPLWIKRTGQRKIKGDDGGCFKAALDAVRTWGGVIEHPWDCNGLIAIYAARPWLLDKLTKETQNHEPCAIARGHRHIADHTS